MGHQPWADGGWAQKADEWAAASPHEVDTWAEESRAVAKDIADHNKKMAQASWKEWCVKALAKGQGIACRFAKPEQPAPILTAEANGEMISNPAAVAEDALEHWAPVWRCGPERFRPAEMAQATRVAATRREEDDSEATGKTAAPPIRADNVAHAIGGQKGTALGPDAWSREEMRALPPEAHGLLATVLNLAEQAGGLPDEISMMQEVLIPKSDKPAPAAAQRNIGLTPRIYRLWTACRQPLLREWRRQRPMQWVWGLQRGRSAPDAAWIAALAGECAKAGGKEAGGLLLDCRQCYERVPLDCVLTAARAEGFPMGVATMALRQYRAPRALRAADALSSWALPNAGLVAGCGVESSLLSCVLAAPFRAIARAAPEATIRQLADDCHVMSTGTAKKVATDSNNAGCMGNSGRRQGRAQRGQNDVRGYMCEGKEGDSKGIRPHWNQRVGGYAGPRIRLGDGGLQGDGRAS